MQYWSFLFSSKDFSVFQVEDYHKLFLNRNGSVIATVGIIFSKPGHNYLDRLNKAVMSGLLANMVVTPDYVRAGKETSLSFCHSNMICFTR